MTYSETDLALMRKEALERLGILGSYCGLNADEIKSIEQRITTKTAKLVAHCHDYEGGRDPLRIVFLALIDYIKDQKRWYKLWRTPRLDKISDFYCKTWAYIDPMVGVAKPIKAAA